MNEGDLKRLFGAAIKTKRAEMGFSQEELADRAGLHRTYVSDVERGARNVSLKSIERLAEALESSVARLFERAGRGDATAGLVEILFVEDNANDVELTMRAFRKARITNPVHVARDGAEALDFVFAKGRHAHRRGAPPPGMILLDLVLPKMDGVEVLRRLKADGSAGKIPVIVLTSSHDYRDAIECKRLGVDTYIVKPVDFRSLSEVTPMLKLEWALVKPPPHGSE